MLERKNFLALNFYKKSSFFGSRGNMNFRISKEEREVEEAKENYFKVIYWPGPYNLASTADTLKQEAEFPFSDEGLESIAVFLNEQYEKQAELWKLSTMR